MPYESLFKSSDHAQKYLAAYHAVLDLWPVPHSDVDVETSYGAIHLNVAGSSDLPPLMLFHGSAVNSTIWYPNIAPLSGHFRVYAPDIPAQMGLSVCRRKVSTQQDAADWIAESMDGLGIERAVLVGHSYGGWLSLNFAMRYPDRVNRLVLLSPAPALAPLNWMLVVRMLLPIFIPTRHMFYNYFQWLTVMPLSDDHVIIEQLMTGAKTFKPDAMAMAVMSVFSDDELAAVTHPSLLLIGEKEVAYKVKVEEVLARARRLMPAVEAELIPDGGHLFPVGQVEATNARMMEFLL